MHQLGGKARKSVRFAVRMSPLNDDIFPLHVPEFAQALPECLDAGRVNGTRGCSQIPYPWNFLRLLSIGGTAKRKEHSAQ
jgi:hypothetical protein